MSSFLLPHVLEGSAEFHKEHVIITHGVDEVLVHLRGRRWRLLCFDDRSFLHTWLPRGSLCWSSSGRWRLRRKRRRGGWRLLLLLQMRWRDLLFFFLDCCFFCHIFSLSFLIVLPHDFVPHLSNTRVHDHDVPFKSSSRPAASCKDSFSVDKAWHPASTKSCSDPLIWA